MSKYNNLDAEWEPMVPVDRAFDLTSADPLSRQRVSFRFNRESHEAIVGPSCYWFSLLSDLYRHNCCRFYQGCFYEYQPLFTTTNYRRYTWVRDNRLWRGGGKPAVVIRSVRDEMVLCYWCNLSLTHPGINQEFMRYGSIHSLSEAYDLGLFPDWLSYEQVMA